MKLRYSIKQLVIKKNMIGIFSYSSLINIKINNITYLVSYTGCNYIVSV